MDIKQPNTTVEVLQNFELSKIKTVFYVPDFERKLGNTHVRKIVEAIKKNMFYDNVIRVTAYTDGRYMVLDGQHRLAALWSVHKENNLSNYTLIVQVFEEEFARMTFRRLNMGKPLTLADHTRAFDDGTKEFFNELRDLVSHVLLPNRTTFVNLMHALKYSKGGSLVTVKPYQLEEFLTTVQKSDYDFCKRFLTAMYNCSPTVPHSVHFRAAVFRNVCRLGYENDLSADEMSKLADHMVRNPILTQYVNSAALTDITVLYKMALGLFESVLNKPPVKTGAV